MKFVSCVDTEVTSLYGSEVEFELKLAACYLRYSLSNLYNSGVTLSESVDRSPGVWS